jgi:hypothetical protein
MLSRFELFLLVYVLILIGCNSNAFEFQKSVPRITKIPLDNGFKEFLKFDTGTIDNTYWVRLLEIENHNWLSVLSYNKAQIDLFCLEKSERRKITLDTNFWNRNYNGVNLAIQEDSFLLFNRNKRMVYVLKAFNDSLKLFDSIYLDKFENDIYAKTTAKFSVWGDENNKNVLLNYVLWRRASNGYFDSSNFMLFSKKLADTINEKKIGFYPERFAKEFIPKYNSNHVILNDSTIVFGYYLSDELFKVALNSNKVLAETKIQRKSKFSKFDRKKSSDIGYNRLQLLKSDKNSELFLTNNRYIVATKTLAKSGFGEPSLKKYFVFNQMLNLVYSDTIQNDSFDSFIEPYKNGFIVLAKNLEYLTYYEIE